MVGYFTPSKAAVAGLKSPMRSFGRGTVDVRETPCLMRVPS